MVAASQELINRNEPLPDPIGDAQVELYMRVTYAAVYCSIDKLTSSYINIHKHFSISCRYRLRLTVSFSAEPISHGDGLSGVRINEVGFLHDVPLEDQPLSGMLYQSFREQLGPPDNLVGKVNRMHIVGYDTQEVNCNKCRYLCSIVNFLFGKAK